LSEKGLAVYRLVEGAEKNVETRRAIVEVERP